MNELEIIIVAVTLGFIFWLALKSITGKKICAICFAVASSWLSLLVSYYLGYFEGQVMIALLIGQSITGVYYLVEKRLGVFRLPAILTLLALFYSALTLSLPSLRALIYLVATWLSLALIASLKNKKIKAIAKRVIECCKNW